MAHHASAAAAAAPAEEARACVVKMVSGKDCTPVGECVIALTAQEERLFTVLLEVVRHAHTHTVIRVAGGWVRDKLLGRTNNDIDIALDNTTGQEFAKLVNEYLKAMGEKTSSIGVIQANPDQSKHLETATTRVLGQWVDFVHLRSETYEVDSRIPTITIGTPLQDAERRDFTVNSLFYNVTNSSIEDFTGQGITDLRARVLRTPLPPMVTFLDDPLRVMRAVRFAARFGFTMVPELCNAARDATIKAALASKVSRERIGTETELMLSGPRPIASVRVLHAFGLAETVFCPPKEAAITGPLELAFSPALPSFAAFGTGSVSTVAVATGIAPVMDAAPALPGMWLQHSAQITEALHSILRLRGDVLSCMQADRTGESALSATAATTANPYSLRASSAPLPRAEECANEIIGFGCPRDTVTAPEAFVEHTPQPPLLAPEHKYVMMLAAVLYPLSSLLLSTKKGRMESLVTHMIIDSLKRKHKDAEDACAIQAGAQMFRRTLVTRDLLDLGMTIKTQVKGLWPASLVLAMALDARPVLYDERFRGSAAAAAEGIAALQRIVAAYSSFLDVIGAHQIDGCWLRKPLLNGKQVMSALSLAGGKEVGVFVEEHAKWQVLHPNGTAEEALAHLMRMRDTGAKIRKAW